MGSLAHTVKTVLGCSSWRLNLKPFYGRFRGVRAMKRRAKGFTLIELLMVILVIGLLAVMLLPIISAVDRAVRIYSTEQRIWVIHAAIGDYKQTFNDYPPSHAPSNPRWHYPPGRIDKGGSTDLFRPHPLGASHRPPGGMFLAYFLMGPEQAGWSLSTHGCSGRWQVPTGLSRMLIDKPVRANDGWRYYFFADGFQRKYRGGTFQYALAQPYRKDTSATSRFYDASKDGTGLRCYALSDAYYYTVRGNYGWGDGRVDQHIQRTTDQCPHAFILISAGVNSKFGYYNWDGTQYRADVANGITDDITNFPLE